MIGRYCVQLLGCRGQTMEASGENDGRLVNRKNARVSRENG
jgi:hypothetical protein